MLRFWVPHLSKGRGFVGSQGWLWGFPFIGPGHAGKLSWGSFHCSVDRENFGAGWGLPGD